MDERQRTATWIPLFVALSAIWGASFLFIKVADRALSPPEVSFVRVAVGALVLAVVLAVSRTPAPRGRSVWGHLALVALIGNVLPFTLFAYGETQISSLLAGIWNATTPLLTLLVVIAVKQEQVTRARAGGLVLGFVGVIVLLGPWTGLGAGALWGDLACLGAAALYALSFPYMRHNLISRGLPPLSLAAGQLLCATVELGLVLAVAGRPPGRLTVAVVLSLLALGALGTGLAFVFSYRLLSLAGATTATSVTYVTPLISTILGIAVLGEAPHPNEPVGAVIVLAGVAVSQRLLAPGRLIPGRRAAARAAAAAAAAAARAP